MRGTADFKITDTLFARVSGVTKNRDGYIKRLDYKLTHPSVDIPTNAQGSDPLLGTLGGTSYAAARLSLRWQPTATIDINVAGDYTRDRSDAGASVLLYCEQSGG